MADQTTLCPLTVEKVDEIAGLVADGAYMAPRMAEHFIAEWRRLTAENAELTDSGIAWMQRAEMAEATTERLATENAALREERDAMQRRAEAAEADWQAALADGKEATDGS